MTDHLNSPSSSESAGQLVAASGESVSGEQKIGATSLGEDREKSTARTGARTLPLLPASATDDAVALALKERGLSRDVYDFIVHNWGKNSALVAALSAEPQ